MKTKREDNKRRKLQSNCLPIEKFMLPLLQTPSEYSEVKGWLHYAVPIVDNAKIV